jgi:putative phosphoribosyl transferase
MDSELPFVDRRQAGRFLAAALSSYRGRDDLLVLGLPRGGIPVAFEVAVALGAPLDVFVVRKLGVPGYEELAMGAIASGGVRVLNESVTASLRIPAAVIDAVAREEEGELRRRETAFRGSRPAPEVAGRTVLLVDDGLATGSTMKAAVAALRAQQPRRVVVAVPVAAPETCAELRRHVDEVVCAATPRPFYAVGQWYADFRQTTDHEVRHLLEEAARTAAPLAAGR